MGDATTDTSMDHRPVIYLTGFGPFSVHKENASEVAVNHLEVTQLEQDLGVKIYKEILQVEYDTVTNVVKKRWEDMKPKLAVHVGVSGQADTIVLEQVAHNCGYKMNDVRGCLPLDGKCCSDGKEVIQSEIDMSLISQAINRVEDLLPCVKSTDPGRFLCDFIYYTSLHKDKSRSAFIHVPTLTMFPKEKIAATIAEAIKEMYKQVVERDRSKISSAL